MSDSGASKLPKGFSREQIAKSAQAAYDYECPHVDAEEQAASKADPEEGGMLKCSGKWFSDKVANNGESQDYDRWFSCEDSPMCEIHGCDSNECRCEPPK